MKLKNSRLWGRPVLVTFDGGIWYWDYIFMQVQFIPHGWKGKRWNGAPIVETIRRSRDDSYIGAVKLALRSELKRINGEYKYEVDPVARQEFFERLGVTTTAEEDK